MPDIIFKDSSDMSICVIFGQSIYKKINIDSMNFYKL